MPEKEWNLHLERNGMKLVKDYLGEMASDVYEETTLSDYDSMKEAFCEAYACPYYRNQRRDYERSVRAEDFEH
jgi:hypothetical protein